MLHVRVLAARAEVPHEQAHRILRLLQPPVGPAPTVFRRHQFAIGPGRIGIRHHDVGCDDFARCECHAACATVGHVDRRDFGIHAHDAALAFDQPDHALDDLARSAHREMHAPAALQMRNEAQDGGGRERVPADQQRVKAQHRADAFVLHVAGDQPVHRAVALQPDQFGRDLQHRRPVGERNVDQLGEAHIEDGFGLLHETFVAVDILGCEAGDFAPHRVRVAGIVEVLAVVEADAVEGRDRPQVDVVGKGLAAQRPQFFQQEGRGDDGRSAVEGEAVLPVYIGATAGRIEFLEHGDAVAAGAEADRRGEAAETGADDEGVRSVGVRGGGHGGGHSGGSVWQGHWNEGGSGWQRMKSLHGVGPRLTVRVNKKLRTGSRQHADTAVSAHGRGR